MQKMLYGDWDFMLFSTVKLLISHWKTDSFLPQKPFVSHGAAEASFSATCRCTLALLFTSRKGNFAYFFQNEGMKKIRMVYSSKRPAIITKENHHFVAGEKKP